MTLRREVLLKPGTVTGLSLRKAMEEDGPFLLAVRNLPEVRALSKNQEVLPEATHHAWFQSQRRSPSNAIWIIEDRDQREGYVRAQDLGDRTWLLNIALEERFRGRGHGTWAIREACRLLKETHGACRLAAEVVSTNTRARRLFESAGFVPQTDFEAGGLTLMRFELAFAVTDHQGKG